MKGRALWFFASASLFVVLGYMLFSGTLGLVLRPRLPFLYWGAFIFLGLITASFFFRSCPLVPPRGGLPILILPLVFLPGVFTDTGGVGLVKVRPYVISEPSGVGEAKTDLPPLSALTGSPLPEIEERLESPDPAALPARPRDIGNEWGEAVQRKFFPTDSSMVPGGGTIDFPDNKFYERYYEVYDRYRSYLGRELSLTGFVHRNEDVEGDRFLLSRMVMWCCTSDTYAVGFIALGMDTEKLEEGTWLTVRGMLEEGDYRDTGTGRSFRVPVLRVSSYSVTPPPKDPYIAPNY